jgi:hypothetical protein
MEKVPLGMIGGKILVLIQKHLSTVNTLETIGNEVCDFPNYGDLRDHRAGPANARKDATSSPWEPTTDEGDQNLTGAVPIVLPSVKNATRSAGRVTPQRPSDWRRTR